VEIVPAAGHSPHVEAVSEVNALLIEHLAAAATS
jgi:hypothetical protein